MSYGKKRSASVGNGNWYYGSSAGATHAYLKEKKDAEKKKKNFGPRIKKIAELMEQGVPREKIDMLIGKPGCSDRDWESAKEYLRQKLNNNKIPEKNYEQRKENQRKYVTKILECVIKSKDYDLEKLLKALEIFYSSNIINGKASDKDIEDYLIILEEYKTKQFAASDFDLMKRVKGALNLDLETVLNSMQYQINSKTQAKWEDFIKIRNKLKAQNDSKIQIPQK